MEGGEEAVRSRVQALIVQLWSDDYGTLASIVRSDLHPTPVGGSLQTMTPPRLRLLPALLIRRRLTSRVPKAPGPSDNGRGVRPSA